MSGVHGHILGHLVRRGVEVAQSHIAATFPDPPQIQQLEADAQLYENVGQEVKPYEMLPIVITGLIVVLIMASIKYTLGEVMATLAMVESPTATAIVEDKPPPYGDEPDAPIEKEPTTSVDVEADVEVTLVRNKPFTGSVRATMRHLHSVGGFFAKWRGVRASILYHFLHSVASNILSTLLGFGLVGHILIYVLVSVGLARFHMVWTHAMIAYPSNQSFFRRLVPRRQCKALLLPAFVFAVAQQLTFILPLAVASLVGFADTIEAGQHEGQRLAFAIDRGDCATLILFVVRVLAVPATAIFVALTILLPAAATLTRIEALLLPETEDTIVPFDREAILGDIDLTARGSSKKLFVETWCSFDGACRWRLIKIYSKLAAAYFFVALAGIHLILAELYVLGAERMAIFLKSAGAQLQLMAIEAEQAQQNAN